MTARFHHEPWRKLYVTKSASWLRLPVLARGLGRELLTYCDDEGRIEIGADDPGAAVAYLLGARPREHKSIVDAVRSLIGDGYLVPVAGALVIRNFVTAQDRTPGAKRTAEWRARERAAADARDAALKAERADAQLNAMGLAETSPETSRVTSPCDAVETSQAEGEVTRIVSCRDVSNRDDLFWSPSSPPEPAGPPEAPIKKTPSERTDQQRTGSKHPITSPEPNAAKPSRKKPDTRCPPSDVAPETLAKWLTSWRIPSPAEDGEVLGFLDHHRAKGSLFADWGAAWRTWTRNAVRFGRRGGAVRPVQPATKIDHRPPPDEGDLPTNLSTEDLL